MKLYATSDSGDGHVIGFGPYENVEDIIIRVEHFADDVVLTIEEIYEIKKVEGTVPTI